MKKWKTISTELVFDNKWFKVQKDVVELPNGRILDDFYVWKEHNVSQIVAVTKENRIVLVKQYKHGTGEILIECPAGYLDVDESFKDAAKRELLEETGYEATNIKFLGKFVHNPTKSSGVVNAFLATEIEKVSGPHPDEAEEIEILEVEIPKAIEMIRKGQIWTSGSISSIFLALNELKYKQ